MFLGPFVCPKIALILFLLPNNSAKASRNHVRMIGNFSNASVAICSNTPEPLPHIAMKLLSPSFKRGQTVTGQDVKGLDAQLVVVLFG